MFQLIVAVISIALVAALAIASIFYGGEAFTKSSEKANVTALVNQAQQISGAYQLYKTDNGKAPAGIADLTAGGYLSALPTPSKIATAAWAFDANGTNVVVPLNATDADKGVCVEVVRQAGGTVATDGTVTSRAAAPQFDCVAGTGVVNFTFKL